MNWFNRLSVRAKLTTGFVFVALIAAVIGATGLTSLSRVNSMAAHMHDFELQGLYQVGRADAELRSAGRSLRGALLAPPGAERDAAISQLQKHFTALEAIGKDIGNYFLRGENQARVQRLRGFIQEYQTASMSVVSLLREGTVASELSARERLVQAARPASDSAEAVMQELLQGKRANAQRFQEEMAGEQRVAFILVAVLTLGGVIIALIMGFLLSRSISRQLGGEPDQVAHIASSIAQGDLTVRINTDGVAPNSIMANMAAMQAALRRLVGAVRTSSQSIASGASQIAAGNADLSQRTEEQAANLTQTASAMEELSGTVQSNADVARQAAQRAMAASRSAENGGEVVDNVVQTMAGITESSKRIVDIISVIDSIAFQTNILALNAAVEAARAGEQGRGFAVVASEVRSLAQKSASAAKDIKALIDDSVQKIEDGSRLVDTAGETMDGIVAEVKQVTDLISEISAATSEQTSGISQVNDAVLQLSDVTQQNAALVEQSAAASGSLNEQAQRLVELVSTFKLENGQSNSANASRVISVPPATIEEGVRRSERPAAGTARGNGAAARGTAGPAKAATAKAESAAAAGKPAIGAPAPALTASKPATRRAANPTVATAAATATAGVTATAGRATYGSGVSKEDDWEEF